MELRYQLQRVLPVRRQEMYGRLGVPYPLEKSPYALHEYRLARELRRLLGSVAAAGVGFFGRARLL